MNSFNEWFLADQSSPVLVECSRILDQITEMLGRPLGKVPCESARRQVSDLMMCSRDIERSVCLLSIDMEGAALRVRFRLDHSVATALNGHQCSTGAAATKDFLDRQVRFFGRGPFPEWLSDGEFWPSDRCFAGPREPVSVLVLYGQYAGLPAAAIGYGRQLSVFWGREIPQMASDELFHMLAADSRRHAVFHGSCVADGYKGAVLLGRTQSGKSTSTLALWECGYRFVSDDVTVLRLEDAAVLPVARPLAIRPMRATGSQNTASEWGLRGVPFAIRNGKLWIDPASLGQHREETATPWAVCFLEGFGPEFAARRLNPAEAGFKAAQYAHSSARGFTDGLIAAGRLTGNARCFSVTLGAIETTGACLMSLLQGG